MTNDDLVEEIAILIASGPNAKPNQKRWLGLHTAHRTAWRNLARTIVHRVEDDLTAPEENNFLIQPSKTPQPRKLIP